MWGAYTRASALNDLTSREFDMLVIGGGITGAGVFLEAARLGLSVLLIEQRDFAWGTSSRSSKLVHGGLRYLKEGRLLLTRESVLMRERLLNEANGLVTYLPFLFPNFEGRSPGRTSLAAGLAVYDVIAGKWRHKHLSAEEIHLQAPHMKADGLQGGFAFGDGQTDDARLVMRVLQEGVDLGGVALNRVKALRAMRTGKQLNGFEVEDTLTGTTFEVRAKTVVNATGAWASRFREGLHLRPLRGSHLMFPAWRFPAGQALTLSHPVDKRPCFVIPWEGATMFGTTDMDHPDPLDEEAGVTSEEVAYLLEALRFYLPELNLVEDDIISSFSGVRPVVSSGQKDPSKETRDHTLVDDNGLITITGGKLTTFRKMAFDVLNKARRHLTSTPALDTKAPVFAPVPVQTFDGLDTETCLRLNGRYGRFAQENAGGDLIPGTLTRWSEVRFAARNEAVNHLDDLLLRRVRLGLLLERGGADHQEMLRDICQTELGWDQARWHKEWRDYLDLYHRKYSVPGRPAPTTAPAPQAGSHV